MPLTNIYALCEPDGAIHAFVDTQGKRYAA